MHVYVIAIASAIMICGALLIVVSSIACITGFTSHKGEDEEQDQEKQDLLADQDQFEYELN